MTFIAHSVTKLKAIQVADFCRTHLEALLPARCLQCEEPCVGPTWLCDNCVTGIARNAYRCAHCALPLTPLIPTNSGAVSAAHTWANTGANTKAADAAKRSVDNKPVTASRCPDCQTTPPPFAAATVPLIYEDTVRDMIRRWKFENRPELTRLLVELALAGAAAPNNIDVIVPIPMSFPRRWRRGYNQAELICWALRRHWRRRNSVTMPVSRALSVTGSRPLQHRLGRVARHDNATNRFGTRRTLVGQRVLLVDDVMTTGATLSAASERLLEAGVDHVEVWALARARRRGPAVDIMD